MNPDCSLLCFQPSLLCMTYAVICMGAVISKTHNRLAELQDKSFSKVCALLALSTAIVQPGGFYRMAVLSPVWQDHTACAGKRVHDIFGTLQVKP